MRVWLAVVLVAAVADAVSAGRNITVLAVVLVAVVAGAVSAGRDITVLLVG